MGLRLWLLPEPPLRLTSTAIDVMRCNLSEMRESWVICAEGLKAHVHPNGFARLCFCFETIVLSNAVF